MIWNTVSVGTVRIKKCFAFLPEELTEESKTVWLRFYYEEQELRYLPHVGRIWWTKASWLNDSANPENKRNPE